MSLACDLCGTLLKSLSALMRHEGSRPCDVARIAREMRERSWVACVSLDARLVLGSTSVEHEVAPAAYVKGGIFRWKEGNRAVGLRSRSGFFKPTVRDGVWCPQWAQEIVDLKLPREVRSQLLERANENAEVMHAMRTTLALGGIEALMGEVLEREETNENDG